MVPILGSSPFVKHFLGWVGMKLLRMCRWSALGKQPGVLIGYSCINCCWFLRKILHQFEGGTCSSHFIIYIGFLLMNNPQACVNVYLEDEVMTYSKWVEPSFHQPWHSHIPTPGNSWLAPTWNRKRQVTRKWAEKLKCHEFQRVYRIEYGKLLCLFTCNPLCIYIYRNIVLCCVVVLTLIHVYHGSFLFSKISKGCGSHIWMLS